MSSFKTEDIKELELPNDPPKDQIDDENVVEYEKDSERTEQNKMPSSQQEEEIIKKKYGGLLPKKPPLISKAHEHAFFDSADWALGKQGAQKPKGPLEALRPKLQPTPHQQVPMRHSAFAPADNNEEAENDKNDSLEDQSCLLGGKSKNNENDNESSRNDNVTCPES